LQRSRATTRIFLRSNQPFSLSVAERRHSTRRALTCW
jgi:hypothetical protein